MTDADDTGLPTVIAAAAPNERFARVEIMGHRSHTGRISEVSQFGCVMLRVEIPADPSGTSWIVAAEYGSAAIFGITPCTYSDVIGARRQELQREFDEREWRRQSAFDIEGDE